MKKLLVLFLLVGLYGCGSQDGATGMKGESGKLGETGPQGPIGSQGPTYIPPINPILPINQAILGKYSKDGTWDETFAFKADGTITYPNKGLNCNYTYTIPVSISGNFNYQITIIGINCTNLPISNGIYKIKYIVDSCINGLCGELIIKNNNNLNMYFYGNTNL